MLHYIPHRQVEVLPGGEVPTQAGTMLGSVRWEHTIEVNGMRTSGRIQPKTQEWVSQCILLDLKGSDVLDIGAWDGYYSFLCEQRGANVLAIDVNPEHRKGFEIIKRLLDSKVEYRTMSVYDLDDLDQVFDYVLFFGVLYHLENPILALRKIRDRCKQRAFIETSCVLSPRSVVDFVWPKHEDKTTYWRFSPGCVKRMCRLAGFKDAFIHSTKWYPPWRRGRTLVESSV